MVGIGALFCIGKDLIHNNIQTENTRYRSNGKAFTKGKRSKSLKGRSNRMKAKAKR